MTVETRKRRTRKKKKSHFSVRQFRDYTKVDLILALCFAGLVLVVSAHFLFKDYFSGVRFGSPDPGRISSSPAGPDLRLRAPTPTISPENSKKEDEEDESVKTEESGGPDSTEK